MARGKGGWGWVEAGRGVGHREGMGTSVIVSTIKVTKTTATITKR